MEPEPHPVRRPPRGLPSRGELLALEIFDGLELLLEDLQTSLLPVKMGLELDERADPPSDEGIQRDLDGVLVDLDHTDVVSVEDLSSGSAGIASDARALDLLDRSDVVEHRQLPPPDLDTDLHVVFAHFAFLSLSVDGSETKTCNNNIINYTTCQYIKSYDPLLIFQNDFLSPLILFWTF